MPELPIPPDGAAALPGGPHPNGARTARRRRPLRTRLLAALAAVVAVAWGWALWYSLNRPAPEPLDETSASLVREACADAGSALRGLDPPGGDAVSRAARVEAENEILAAMVAAIGSAEPPDESGAEALEEWRADWSAVVDARAGYADQLRAGVERPRLALPIAGGGTKPVTVRMDQYADAHGLAACRSGSLQAEVVEGERVYGGE